MTASAPATHATIARSGAAGLTLGALGVVFGDIGTSPLYAMHEVFAGHHPMAPDPDRVHGVLSLIFWSLIIIVTLKYLALIMRANNDGEGGIMALIALIQRITMKTGGAKLGLIALGIFGASLFYGDGMITPAISVLSAVEGLQIVSPSLDEYVVPLALAVLTALFVIQRFGTGAVGALFGPVMIVWFTVIAAAGLLEVVKRPAILKSVSPTYGVEFFVNEPGTAFLALGSVVLAVTGAEALYADMGHFGRPAIARSWLFLVLPALMLNYMGQGALVLGDPSAVDNPFYRLVPEWSQVPMVILATLATVIASQAVISGAFSVTRQAVQLGFLPRMLIRHTSEKEAGQIYIPFVNWALYVAIIGLVIGFGSSSSLASAYGIAVTGTLAIDTLLAFVVIRRLWGRPLWQVVAGASVFLIVDLAFFSANLTKIGSGGWFPLVVAAIVFTALMTWRRGRQLAGRAMRDDEISLRLFINKLVEKPPVRAPGTGVFMTQSEDSTPLALIHNLEHNHIIHEHTVLLTVRTRRVPHVPAEERVSWEQLRIGFSRVVADFGFQDDQHVLDVLSEAQRQGLDIDVEEASFFLNRVTIFPQRGRGMAFWRKRLFALLSRNATSPARHFGLPANRVVEIGTHVDL